MYILYITEEHIPVAEAAATCILLRVTAMYVKIRFDDDSVEKLYTRTIYYIICPPRRVYYANKAI